jgi:hypothetical protein
MSNTNHTPGYEVAESGNVFSVKHNWRGYGKRRLFTSFDSDGYLYVRMTIEGKRRKYFIHKLVAALYLPERPSANHEIRHLNGNKQDNHFTNLAWGTKKENAADREKHGKTSRGLKHSKAVKKGIYANR